MTLTKVAVLAGGAESAPGGVAGDRVSRETLSRPKRRAFSASEKLRIIKAADACAHGELGALLRREGIYSSQLTEWRRQFDLDSVKGLEPGRPGRKSRLSAAEKQRLALEKKTAKLEKELALAKAVIELQKKAHALLGIALPTIPDHLKLEDDEP